MPPHDQLDEDLLVNDEPENDLLRDPDPLRDPPLEGPSRHRRHGSGLNFGLPLLLEITSVTSVDFRPPERM